MGVDRVLVGRVAVVVGEPPDHEWAVPNVRDIQSAIFGYSFDFGAFEVARVNEIAAWVKEHIDSDSDEYLFEQRHRIDSQITAIVKGRIWPTLPSKLRRADSNTRFRIETGFKAELMYLVIEFNLIDHGMPPVFFTRLLPAYEAGRYPCGWEGDYPEGRLIVF